MSLRCKLQVAQAKVLLYTLSHRSLCFWSYVVASGVGNVLGDVKATNFADMTEGHFGYFLTVTILLSTHKHPDALHGASYPLRVVTRVVLTKLKRPAQSISGHTNSTREGISFILYYTSSTSSLLFVAPSQPRCW